MKNTFWQVRAKEAGLTQETLRGLLGLTKSGMSQGIRGAWEGGIVPVPIRATIIAWELMGPDQRTAWIAAMRSELAVKPEANGPPDPVKDQATV